MIKYLLLILMAALSAFIYQAVQPIHVGVSVTLNEVKIPYSWDVRPQNVPLAIVSPPDAEWLRIMSFNEYVNGTWLRGKPLHPPELTGGTVFKVTVTPIGALTFNYLPYPQPAPGYRPSGRFNGDVLPLTSSSQRVIVKYRAPYPYANAPELEVPLKSLQLKPQKLSTKRVQELAQRLASNATTLKDLIDNIQRLLRRYRYALYYTGKPAEDPVDWFLFVSKTGMCVHFASAAAILLRDVGIDARLVVGLAVSKKVDGIRVFTLPMHAWVEVYVPGKGWVAWDPSPRIRLNETSVPMGGPPVPAGGVAINAPRPQAPRVMPRITINQRWLSYTLIALAFLALIYRSKPKPKPWPLIFRKCVESCYNVRGLTLEETANLVGGKLGEEIKKYYIRLMRGERRLVIRPLLHALLWCMKCFLGRRSRS